MKLLFENWRRYLAEGMKMPEDLPDGLQVRMEYDGDFVQFQIVDEETGQAPTLERQLEKFGRIDGAVYLGKYTDNKGNKCLDAWEVRSSEALGGFGPMLYDLAMEYATQNGGGLISDRHSVTDEAYMVWKRYYDQRDDVESTQLDNLENELTPDEEDNCIQMSSIHWGEKRGIPWEDTSTARIYRKTSAEMEDKLRKAGKLYHA